MHHLRTLGAMTALVAATATTTAAVGPASATTPPTTRPTAAASTSPQAGFDSLQEAAEAAYTFTYPLMTMEVSRRQATNVPVPIPGTPAAPTNQLGSLDDVPEAGFDDVVRPNVDTLYTSMFFDVSKEPLVVSMPDTDGRFHLSQVMDAWSEVVGSPGSRTLGEDVDGYEFALVGPGWDGELPAGVHEVRVDTSTGWMLTRIAVDADDPADVEAVNALQEQIEATPLSRYGSPYRPPVNVHLHPDWPGQDDQVAAYLAALSAEEYWDLWTEAASHGQVRRADRAVVADLRAWGWDPRTGIDLDDVSGRQRQVWERAKTDALAAIDADTGPEPVEGWSVLHDDVGTYGSDYVARARTARHLFAANKPEDALYATSSSDATGTAYDASHDYVLHLEADEVPDVQGFWSITLYDEQGALVENPVDRSAVRGERLATNPDGSVDVYVSSESPGPELESNWLPAPAEGGFTLALRAYWPDESVLDDSWTLPGVVTRR